MRVKQIELVGGPYSTADSIIAASPAALGSNLGVPQLIQKKNSTLLRLIDSTLLREREIEWTVQSLVVDETHLVLFSAELVLQKIVIIMRHVMNYFL